MFHPYLRRSASKTCCLFRLKPCFGSGRTFNLVEAPFSHFMIFIRFCGSYILFFKLFNKSIYDFSQLRLLLFLQYVSELPRHQLGEGQDFYLTVLTYRPIKHRLESFYVGVIFSIHSFFITSPKIFLRSEVAVPYCDEVRILRHPSASFPDGPDPPFVIFVIDVAFNTMSSFISLNAIA